MKNKINLLEVHYLDINEKQDMYVCEYLHENDFDNFTQNINELVDYILYSTLKDFNYNLESVEYNLGKYTLH